MVITLLGLTACQTTSLKDPLPKKPNRLPNVGTASVGGGKFPGGGGNGADDAVYEHFRFKPRDSDAFKKYLKPLFDHLIAGVRAKDMNKVDSLLDRNAFFLDMKNWYVIPFDNPSAQKKIEQVRREELDNPSEDIGAQQLAYQTQYTVWIDANHFGEEPPEKSDPPTMCDREPEGDRKHCRQAELIMHEWVVSMYGLKFWDIEDYFNLTFAAAGVVPEHSIDDMIKRMYPAQPSQPLGQGEYSAIRRVTSFFLDQAMSLDILEIFQKLLANGFDPRFFDVSYRHSQPKPPLVLEAKETLKLLKSVLIPQGGLNDDCYFLYSEQKLKCQISANFKETILLPVYKKQPHQPIKCGTWATPATRIQIANAESKISHSIVNLNGSPQTLMPFAVWNREDSFYFLTTYFEWKRPPAEGDLLTQSILIFKENPQTKDLKFDGIIVNPLVITGEEVVDFKHQVELTPLTHKSLQDDILIITNSPRNLDTFRFFASTMRLPTQSFQKCDD